MVQIQELNFATAEAPVPKIKYVQVLQNQGGQAVTIQPTGGSTSTFYSANHAFYMDKSYLQFKFTPPLAGTTPKANWVSAEGVPYISQIRGFFKSSTTEFLNIQNFNKYMNATARHNTSISDVMTRDKTCVQDTATNDALGQFEVLNCNNSAVIGEYGAIRPDNTNARTLLIEPAYLTVGADTTATPVIDCFIKFDFLKDTIGELKQLFFTGGQDLVFEITWAPLYQIMWTAAGAASAADPSLAPFPNTGNGTISDLRLMVATETDSEILAWAAHKFNTEGFKYHFRNVTGAKGPSSNSTQHQVDARMTAGAGKRLLKVHWIPYFNAETLNNVYNHDNRAGTKIANYQTYVNDRLIPNGAYYIGNGTIYGPCDDYNKDKERLRGSCILSRDEYYYNWCATVDFTIERPKDMPPAAPGVLPEANLEQGIALGPFETKISFIGQVPGVNSQNFAHYLFYVTERELVVTPSAIALY